jgi:hypothetical protein
MKMLPMDANASNNIISNTGCNKKVRNFLDDAKVNNTIVEPTNEMILSTNGTAYIPFGVNDALGLDGGAGDGDGGEYSIVISFAPDLHRT